MPATDLRVEDALVAPLADETYAPRLHAVIGAARRRCLCSVFIVDTWPFRANELRVDELLVELAATAWRGVDTRLLIGGSRSNLRLAEVALAARDRARELGIPCRWLTSAPRRRGSHVKLAVIDDDVLTGSHNWSAGAFEGQTQDSLHLRSADLAAVLAARFESQWRRTPAEAAGV